MANINFQRKGIRITIVVFGPRLSGKHSFLEKLRTMCRMPGEMMSVPEEGGELFSFFASLEPKKVDGVEVHARFLTAKDLRGDGTVWQSVLKQADGVVFLADGSPGQEFENLKAQSILNQLFPSAPADAAQVFFYNKSDLPGAMSKAQLDDEINHAKKPSFTGNSLSGAGVGETALAAVKTAFARFQKQYTEMGGTGSLDAKIGLAIAGATAAPSAPVVSVTPAPAPEPPATAPEPPAPVRSKSPSSDELDVVLDTELFDAEVAAGGAPQDVGFPMVEARPPLMPAPADQTPPSGEIPPALPEPPPAQALPSIIVTDLPVEPPTPYAAPPAEAHAPRTTTREVFAVSAASSSEFPAAEAAEFERKLLAMSAAVEALPSICETVAHAAVAVRMLSGKIDGLEQAAGACAAGEFDAGTARAIAARLREAVGAVASLKAENERLHQHLDGEIASRNQDAAARVAAVAEAQTAADEFRAREERLKTLLSERAAQIEQLKTLAGGREEELKKYQQEVEEYRTAIRENSAREQDLVMRLSEAVGEAASARTDAERGQAQLGALRESGSSAGAEIAALHQKVSETEAAAMQAAQDLHALRVECDGLRAKVETSAGETAGLRTGIQEANADMAALAARAGEAEGRCAALQQEMQTLASRAERVAGLEELLAGERARAGALEGELTAARAQVQSALQQEATGTVLREQLGALTQMLDRKNRELEVSIQQVTGLERSLEEARAGAQTSAGDDARRLGQELVVLQLELQSRDEQLQMLQAQLSAKEGEAAAFRSQATDYARQIQAQQAQAAAQPPTPYTPASAVHQAQTRMVTPASKSPPPPVTGARLPPRHPTMPPSPPPHSSVVTSAAPVPKPSAPVPYAAPVPAGQQTKPPVPYAAPVPAGFVNQDPAHAGARQMAKVLVATFIRKHEKDIISTLANGTFHKAFDPIVKELRKTYDAHVPPQVVVTNDYFKEELETAIGLINRKA